MWRERIRSDEGLSLMELMIAMAIFAVVLGAAAQGLVSYYVALDIQNQRNTALRNCTGILNNMRDIRDANPDLFPQAITDQWPDGAAVTGAGTLPQEVVTVTYDDPAANPLAVTVTSTWVDMQGRPMTMSVSTMLTDV